MPIMPDDIQVKRTPKTKSRSPVFAVEMRGPRDHGPQADAAIARKRAEYFASGTLVYWDVDVTIEDVVKSYRASDPDNPIIFRRGDIADAEPAVRGWRVLVDDLITQSESEAEEQE
jgi:hypothetical protein